MAVLPCLIRYGRAFRARCKGMWDRKTYVRLTWNRLPDSSGIQGVSPILPSMSRIFRIAALAALVFAAAAPARDAMVARDSDAAVRARVIELVNAARGKARRCGSERYPAAPPLTASRDLDEAASRHARDMLKKKFFEHTGSDGSQPRDRVKRAGYQSRLTGENIALGPESAEEVVAGWLASPGHCENIMDARFQNIGVGIATGKKRGQIYWVQTFGQPLKAAR